MLAGKWSGKNAAEKKRSFQRKLENQILTAARAAIKVGKGGSWAVCSSNGVLGSGKWSGAKMSMRTGRAKAAETMAADSEEAPVSPTNPQFTQLLASN